MTSQETALEEVRGRLAKLEKQNRRLKRLGAAALVAAASLALLGQAPAKRTVEANEFILKDAGGKVRARLAFCDNAPCLVLLDTNANARATLDITGLTANRLFLIDLKGETWGALGMLEAGPSFSLFGRNGKEQAALRLAAGEPALALSDANGQRELVATIYRDSPHLWFADQEEKEHLYIGLNGSEPSISLNGSEPSIVASDAEGYETSIGSSDLVNPKTGETRKTSAASLVLFDKDKHVIWHAP
jgi:hypothetical protein